ncbi:hypothetical protein E2R51_12245 [Jeotgalibacillus sp. S-D1]|uniref:hypothetical protein n=1 Tax=Jeotgalibacillus sp. S-D1 TaxID=2552189 RepID=UPI001059CE88|nr:hypothetical protein [Jeotgalibacillus sp. S-D1]TDL31979.1 hypothetical protein E2R51_12245 [Jeotgalibacillus sp. S-D1]
MKKYFLSFLQKKDHGLTNNHAPVELSDEEMMGIEGASNEYLDHFYEQDRVKGILDPIYQKAL